MATPVYWENPVEVWVDSCCFDIDDAASGSLSVSIASSGADDELFAAQGTCTLKRDDLSFPHDKTTAASSVQAPAAASCLTMEIGCIVVKPSGSDNAPVIPSSTLYNE